MRAGIAESAVTEIWPENLAAFEAFGGLLTQWRTGRTGLDYAALPVVMDLQDVPPSARRQMFEDIRLMEAAALEAMRKKK
jgi:hypothetical protein